ncbi:hypothetical protein CPB83DRAFT_948437 [Crepidotus variabilis]|uniref:Uncharacterized protein n=1 Tax=Crepidotus variabilis TaxID=179855 RepID=A0A9P6E849_9AGAR|nr:hypothetical protein CPB83DRAFT_948437 [Crepidotus variabilis]
MTIAVVIDRIQKRLRGQSFTEDQVTKREDNTAFVIQCGVNMVMHQYIGHEREHVVTDVTDLPPLLLRQTTHPLALLNPVEPLPVIWCKFKLLSLVLRDGLFTPVRVHHILTSKSAPVVADDIKRLQTVLNTGESSFYQVVSCRSLRPTSSIQPRVTSPDTTDCSSPSAAFKAQRLHISGTIAKAQYLAGLFGPIYAASPTPFFDKKHHTTGQHGGSLANMSTPHFAHQIAIKINFVPTPNSNKLRDFDKIYNEVVKRSPPSLVSAPPTQGVGTVRSSQGGRNYYKDDGGLSSDSGGEEEEEFVDASDMPPDNDDDYPNYNSSNIDNRPQAFGRASTPETPISIRGKFNPRKFVRKLSGLTSSSSAGQANGAWLRKENKDDADWLGHGSVRLIPQESLSHARYPTLSNSTWDDYVCRYEKAFKIKFTILDWDKLLSDNLIGKARLDMKQLLDNVLTPDPTTGLYPPSDKDGEEKHVQDCSLKLSTQKLFIIAAHGPLLTVFVVRPLLVESWVEEHLPFHFHNM